MLRSLCICLSALLASSKLEAQPLVERIVMDICKCFNNPPKGLTPDYKIYPLLFNQCLGESMEQHQEELIQSYKDTASISDSSYETGYQIGYQLGKALGKPMQLHLINSCDTYANIVDSARFIPFLNPEEPELSQTVQNQLYERIGKFPNDDSLYFALGMLHLKRLELVSAKNNFTQAVKLDSSKAQYWYFMGFIQELYQDYDHALACYRKSQTLAGPALNHNIEVVCLIVERKIRLLATEE